jgi:D-alanyl-D-alanine dipeptidase
MARAAEEAGRADLAGLLVTPSADLLYLAGYDPPLLPRLTCLVLRPGADPVLLVPELERPRALAGPPGRTLEVAGWRDGDDPYEALARLTVDRGTYGAADRMWAVHLMGIERALPQCDFVPASRVLAGLRAVKDPAELDLLARAARCADATFNRIVEGRLEGRREEEMAATLADLLLEAGHEQVAFTIVASGPNGASPHHEPGPRTIRAGDAVVLDFGGRIGGYCSDMSRTVCIDRQPAERFTEVYDVVREAQEAAFQAVRPGVAAQDVDRAARHVIESAGFGDRFLHRTGHGIGLDEHEAPYIVAGNRDPLRPGMCFSIEPGIYLEDRFGVRIEDIVSVAEEGAVRLNRASRDLETVP